MYFNIFFVTMFYYLTEAEIGIYRVLFDIAYFNLPIFTIWWNKYCQQILLNFSEIVKFKAIDGRLLGFSTFIFVGLIIFTPIFY